MKRVWIFGIAVAVVAAAGVALAQMGPGMMGGGQPRGEAQQSGPPMGPGMIGPGMMGPGGQAGPGMGPGMMGPGGGMGPGRMMGSQQGGMEMGPGRPSMQGMPGMMMGPGQGMGPGMMMGASPQERPLISQILSAKDQLGLTADQEQRLRRLRTEFEKEAIRRGAEIQAAEVDLRELLAAETPDLGKVETQVKRVGALQAELRFARITVLQERRGILTKEQWQKFEALGSRPRPMGPGRGQRQGGQPG